MMLAILLVFGLFIPSQTETVSAAENALSKKSWNSAMTAVLKSKDGAGYNEMGLCTGFVCWAIQQAELYDVSDFPDNGYVSDVETWLINKGVTKVSRADAKAGDIVFFGDAHVAILGEDDKLHHNTTSAGVVSAQHTIEWWLEYGGNKTGEVNIYRGFLQEIEVEITVNKETVDKTFIDGNACYSLEGAKYGVYSAGKLLATLTTNAKGVAKGTITIMPDAAKSITIKELESSDGHGKDTTVYKKDGSSGKIVITSPEPPTGDPITVLVYKSDAETGKNLNAGELKQYYPQKGGSLAGAVFKVDFYGIKKTDMPANGNYSSLTPLRTWYVKTDENGYARLGEKWLADGYKQDAFYKDPITGTITMPLGTVAVQEIKAPEGYFLNDKVFTSAVNPDGDNVIVHTYQAPVVPDTIKRGDFDFTKAADDTQKRLANVPFMITAIEEDGKEVTNGESHIIVTDANGYASTANSFNAHSNNTNANDKAWDGTKIDESKLDPAAGIWFGESSALKANRGALPYGKYRLDELPCKANEGYTLIQGLIVTVTRDGYTAELGTLTDKKNEFETVVWDSDLNEERISLARKNVTLTDRVSMKGMEKGESYTLKGTIMDKESGEPLKVGGKTVTAEKNFKASDTNCIVDVDFTFDASGLAGKQVVVFQKLQKDGVTIASHEDIENPDQAIEFLNPFIGTTATDPEFGINYSSADEEVTIIDRIKYSNILRGGYTYEMVGWLMDKETGEPVLINGEEVTASKKFTSNKASGSLEMEFTFDATSLKGKDIVVFEELYFDGEKIAEHKELSDEGQTIHFPEIKTTARDSETEDHIAYADDKVTVTDTISYRNVKPNEDYTAEGRLINKETGETITEATSTFTAAKTDGEAEVTFEFDGKGLAGKDAVVYEKLLFKGKVIATHEDINDEKQTIHFPEIKTSAWDRETKDHISYADDKVLVTDTISYRNVLPNEEYTAEGSLIDKETGDVIAQATATFTAEKANGEADVTFEFDGKEFAGKDAVVYEKLLFKGKTVADHSDINDEKQTIHLPKIQTSAWDNETKDHISYAGEKVTVTDTISYENVLPGQEYTAEGSLINKETSEVIATASSIFTAEKADGKVDVVFEFDGKALAGKDAVVYEKLFFKGVIVADHQDIDDEEQTISFPEIKTKAWDSETEDHISYADGKVKVIDTVSYKNVLPHEEYTAEGSLINKKTGKIIAEATTTFTAEQEEGEVDVVFEFDGKDLAGMDTVVYESLMFKVKMVADHTDIDDEEQTIHFPEIGTKAAEKSSGKQKVEYEDGKTITIVDTVSYKNLIKGKEYRISGILMDKETGKPVTAQAEGKEGIVAEKTFTAKSENGEVKVEFAVDISKLKDKSIVVFEKLYLEDDVVASHEDIKDKDQTVVILPPSVKTGDDMDIWFWAALAAAAAIGAVTAIRRRKKA